MVMFSVLVLLSLYFSLHIKRKKNVIIISLGSLIFSALPFIEFEECSLYFFSPKYFNIERVLLIPILSCINWEMYLCVFIFLIVTFFHLKILLWVCIVKWKLRARWHDFGFVIENQWMCFTDLDKILADQSFISFITLSKYI